MLIEEHSEYMMKLFPQVGTMVVQWTPNTEIWLENHVYIVSIYMHIVLRVYSEYILRVFPQVGTMGVPWTMSPNTEN